MLTYTILWFVDDTMIRLGLAVTRGLLLDLVATGDAEQVDAAYARFIQMVVAATTPAGEDRHP